MRTALMVASFALLAACLQRADDQQVEDPLPTIVASLSIEQSREQLYTTVLSYERALDDGPSFTAYLVSYEHTGLKLYAMVAVPKAGQPESGYPVVIANHGYVPDPTRYGITDQGVDSRPGDYYRFVPELYASRGFLVVLPDYRGHNSSEGYKQIADSNRESADLYATDVLALISALGDIEHADLANVFMWSHSLGGDVSLRVLLATDRIKAAAFWSTTRLDTMLSKLGELDCPVIVQHAADDRSVDFTNSARLVAELKRFGHPHTFFRYGSDDHLFDSELRDIAADRDVEFFLSR